MAVVVTKVRQLKFLSLLHSRVSLGDLKRVLNEVSQFILSSSEPGQFVFCISEMQTAEIIKVS